MSYPPSFRPEDGARHRRLHQVIADDTDLALILFAVTTWGFGALHPSKFPPEAIAAMAKFPTAAAVKYEANPPATTTGIADLLRRCKNDVIIEVPLEQYRPG